MAIRLYTHSGYPQHIFTLGFWRLGVGVEFYLWPTIPSYVINSVTLDEWYTNRNTGIIILEALITKQKVVDRSYTPLTWQVSYDYQARKSRMFSAESKPVRIARDLASHNGWIQTLSSTKKNLFRHCRLLIQAIISTILGCYSEGTSQWSTEDTNGTVVVWPIFPFFF